MGLSCYLDKKHEGRWIQNAMEVPSILVTYVCSMMGIVAYLTYDAGNGWLSHAFGSIYRTDFSAHLFFLVCCMLWISRKKIWYWESIFILWIAWFVDRYCAARNSTICLINSRTGSFFYSILSGYSSVGRETA